MSSSFLNPGLITLFNHHPRSPSPIAGHISPTQHPSPLSFISPLGFCFHKSTECWKSKSFRSRPDVNPNPDSTLTIYIELGENSWLFWALKSYDNTYHNKRPLFKVVDAPAWHPRFPIPPCLTANSLRPWSCWVVYIPHNAWPSTRRTYRKYLQTASRILPASFL